MHIVFMFKKIVVLFFMTALAFSSYSFSLDPVSPPQPVNLVNFSSDPFTESNVASQVDSPTAPVEAWKALDVSKVSLYVDSSRVTSELFQSEFLAHNGTVLGSSFGGIVIAVVDQYDHEALKGYECVVLLAPGEYDASSSIIYTESFDYHVYNDILIRLTSCAS